MKTLVRFSGDDQPARPKRTPSPGTMFRLGSDTAAIAEALGISEAVALKRVTLERCRRLGLPTPDVDYGI